MPLPPVPEDPVDLEALLARVNAGDDAAQDQFFGQAYDELRSMATRAVGGQRPSHTLQPTAIVNEAWLRLFGKQQRQWNDHTHFMKTAATAMRQILCDYARRRGAGKRIPKAKLQSLELAYQRFDARLNGQLHELNDALEELAARDPEIAEFAELRFFGGCEIADAAEILGVSTNRGIRMWRTARAFVKAKLGE